MNNKRRSQRMENAALLLGVIGAATFCLVYPALICGSLAIVFALLSRGGERTLTSRAKAALILGSIALGIVLAMIIYTFAIYITAAWKIWRARYTARLALILIR